MNGKSFDAPFYRSPDYQLRYPGYLKPILPPKMVAENDIHLYPKKFSVRKFIFSSSTDTPISQDQSNFFENGDSVKIVTKNKKRKQKYISPLNISTNVYPKGTFGDCVRPDDERPFDVDAVEARLSVVDTEAHRKVIKKIASYDPSLSDRVLSSSPQLPPIIPPPPPPLPTLQSILPPTYPIKTTILPLESSEQPSPPPLCNSISPVTINKSSSPSLSKSYIPQKNFNLFTPTNQKQDVTFTPSLVKNTDQQLNNNVLKNKNMIAIENFKKSAANFNRICTLLRQGNGTEDVKARAKIIAEDAKFQVISKNRQMPNMTYGVTKYTEMERLGLGKYSGNMWVPSSRHTDTVKNKLIRFE